MPWFWYLHLDASAAVIIGLLFVVFILLCLLCEDGLEILDMFGIGQWR